MITYNAKDLIQQAQMLADLQNSDFISWKENIMFLDNAWTELYQSLINHGDKTFLQEFSFSGNRTYLPDDFYQLYYVSYYNGTYEQPIARKAKTSTGQGPYYDIVGNELIVYRDSVSNLNQVRVQYYPVKQGITYKVPPIELNTNNEVDFDHVIDLCDYYAIVSKIDNDNEYRYIWNLRTNEMESCNAAANFIYIKHNKPMVIHKESNYLYLRYNNKPYVAAYSPSSSSLSIYRGTSTVSSARRGVYTNIDHIWWDNIVKDTTGTLINDSLYIDFAGYAAAGINERGVCRLDLNANKMTFISRLYPIGRPSVGVSSIVGFNDNFYYFSPEGVMRNYTLIEPLENFDTYNGILKEDMDTGYGMLLDNYTITGIYDNTELSFPNNFYYNYLAYKLAIYYKIKQNADPSGLMLSLNDAEKTFYNTLSRDENNFIRISNAYAY